MSVGVEDPTWLKVVVGIVALVASVVIWFKSM